MFFSAPKSVPEKRIPFSKISCAFINISPFANSKKKDNEQIHCQLIFKNENRNKGETRYPLRAYIKL